MGNPRARKHLVSGVVATWRTVCANWKHFIVPELALAFGYWFVRQPPAPNQPRPNPWEGIEALVVAAAILVGCIYLAHVALSPVASRLSFEWRKRKAYRELWSVDGDLKKVMEAAAVTAFNFNGMRITVREVLHFIAKNTDHATYQAIETAIIGKCNPATPAESKKVTGSAANLFLVLKHNDMLFIHKDDSSGNAGPYMMEPLALRLLENLRVGEIAHEFGPPRWWT